MEGRQGHIIFYEGSLEPHQIAQPGFVSQLSMYNRPVEINEIDTILRHQYIAYLQVGMGYSNVVHTPYRLSHRMHPIRIGRAGGFQPLLQMIGVDVSRRDSTSKRGSRLPPGDAHQGRHRKPLLQGMVMNREFSARAIIEKICFLQDVSDCAAPTVNANNPLPLPLPTLKSIHGAPPACFYWRTPGQFRQCGLSAVPSGFEHISPIPGSGESTI